MSPLFTLFRTVYFFTAPFFNFVTKYDVLGIIDLNGNLVVKYNYTAFGGVSIVSDTSGIFIGTRNPFKWKGYYYDVETGLFMVGHRYYNPEWGRWIQPDSIEYLDPSSINGLNLYAYCNNDPVNMIDPDGHLPKWAAWLISGALVAGGIALSVLTAGVATPGVVGALATIGGIIGGAAVGAGAGSLIGGYVNEATGGSFEAGYVSGLISGALTGAGASGSGAFLVAASKATGLACIGYLGASVSTAFAGGALGDFLGNYALSQMDNTQFDLSSAFQSAILAGSLNIFAGIGVGISSIVGGLSRAANVTMNMIVASRLAASMIIIGTEAAYDLISYLIRKVF